MKLTIRNKFNELIFFVIINIGVDMMAKNKEFEEFMKKVKYLLVK